MDINPNAPATAHKEIRIAAPAEVVWAVHADVDSWSTWHPEITTATLEGSLEPGAKFTWKAGGPGTIASTLRVVEPHRRISWIGNVMGIRAVHAWRFEPDEAGTRVVTEESMEGWPVSLLTGYFQRTLDETLEAWLAALRAEAEARASS